MLYLAIFISFVLIIYILFFLNINIRAEYVRNGWDDRAVLSIYTFAGIIKYRYEINLVDIEKNGIKLMRIKKKKVEKEQTEGKGKKRTGFEELYERIIYIREQYNIYRNISKRLNDYLKNKIILRELDLNIVLGTGDACATGILSGAVWAVVGIIMSLLLRNKEFKKRHVDIKSDFNRQKLDINLYCIFSIKFVHIIVVGFIFLSNYLKRRWYSWQNIRYKVL